MGAQSNVLEIGESIRLVDGRSRISKLNRRLLLSLGQNKEAGSIYVELDGLENEHLQAWLAECSPPVLARKLLKPRSCFYSSINA